MVSLGSVDRGRKKYRPMGIALPPSLRGDTQVEELQKPRKER